MTATSKHGTAARRQRHDDGNHLGTSSNTICAPDGSADGGAGGGLFIGGGGGGACVRRGEESSRCGGRVAGVARVCRVGRRRDGGSGGGGGRWNGVGRGWWGAGERVHRRNCAGGRVEVRIRRRGGEARAEVSGRVFSRSPRPMPRAGAEAQSLVPRIGQTGPRPKKFAAPRRMQRLLEEHFRDPALHIGGLYSARPT
jgi:hypothetical protein